MIHLDMFGRKVLTDILELLENFPSVMLYGPRQIGKTTIAKSIAEIFPKKTHYFDLEKESDAFPLKTNAHEFLMALKDDLVILDEVQLYPQLLSFLRSIIDEHRIPGRFILLGSADPQLVTGVSESLAGRVIYKEINQITFLEATEQNISLEQHWFRGGFPEALQLKSDKMWTEWTQSFIQTYIYRDINLLFGINLSPQIIAKMWSMLAHLNSDIENMQNLGRSLGLTGTSAKKYLDYMEGAYLIRRLAPWHQNNGKRLVKSPKLYVRTWGVLHHLLQITSYHQLQTNPALGASWEGYVVEQIHAAKPKEIDLYYYRTHHGAEVDLVLIKGVKPIATIEIKYSNAPVLSRGYYESLSDLETKDNFVITPNSQTVTTKEGVQVLGLEAFLKDDLINKIN
ncbi:ATP-binding protein [Pedobacter sp. SD-b]|uniref:ATP-binding protein n=1 Tax=Pedobacter segetis TaxID=2793069 RepID=A0ABS1BH38_9SPHI|nr:ATP-binding protein [Pedobacter segetis]MBK0381686.1 ATP-binding protein [Pedobacter segetis]